MAPRSLYCKVLDSDRRDALFSRACWIRDPIAPGAFTAPLSLGVSLSPRSLPPMWRKICALFAIPWSAPQPSPQFPAGARFFLELQPSSPPGWRRAKFRPPHGCECGWPRHCWPWPSACSLALGRQTGAAYLYSRARPAKLCSGWLHRWSPELFSHFFCCV